MDSAISKALTVVYALSQGQQRWTMSVPAQPDTDPDLVIYGALWLAVQELDRLRAERSAALDLLAVIHRDGGHHTEGVGFIKSCSDAIAVRNALVVDNDRLRAENERQRKRVDELQAELHAKNDLWRMETERAERAEEDNKRLRGIFNSAIAVVGANESLAYVRSGNCIPVSRCTVPAGFIKMLIEEREKAEDALREAMDAVRKHGSAMSNDEILAMLATAKEGKS